MSTVSAQQILKDTFLTESSNGHKRPQTLQLLYVVPGAAVAVAVALVRPPVFPTSTLLTATSILTGLTFTMALTFWKQSIDARRDPLFATDASRLNLLDRMRAHLVWTVFVGVVSTATMVVTAIFTSHAVPLGVVMAGGFLAVYQITLVGGALLEFYRASYDLR